MADPVDIETLRRWIGREEGAEDTVTAELVQRFRAAMDLPGGRPEIGETAPPLIHFCFSLGIAPTASLGPDGHPQRGDFLPPVPLPRRMWAGSDLEFGRPIRVGDTLRRASRIADVVVKEGRTGTLCFVTVEHRIAVEDETAVTEKQTVVYRGADAAPGKGGGEPAPQGHWHKATEAGPPLLFRYSAVTFNGHRIHYDRQYVTDVEPYPGLVVHGPLQATMLINFASEIRGTMPSIFRFRSGAPLFDVDRFSLNADEADGGLKLWTAREGGPAAMTAEAQWA